MLLTIRFGHAISTCDCRRMDALNDEMPCILQPFSGQKHCRGRPIADGLILCSTGSDEHVCNWMLNLCRFKDRNAIVRDHTSPFIIDEQFVKALWSKRRANRTCKGNRGLNVLAKSVSSSRTVRFLKNRDIAHGRTNGDLHISAMFSLLHQQLRNLRRRRHRLQH